MGRNKGDTAFTRRERYLLKSIIKDALIFGATEPEILAILEKKVGHTIHERTYYNLKKEIEIEEGSADEWIENFTRFGIASHFKKRIDEVEYIQRTMLLLYAQELDREKKNVYAIDRLGNTIVNTSKVLAEYGMAPPIIAKIKSMIPLEISSLNKRLEDTQENLKNTETYIKSLDLLDNSSNEDKDEGNRNGNIIDKQQQQQTSKSAESIHGSKAETAPIPSNGKAIRRDPDPEDDEDDNAVF